MTIRLLSIFSLFLMMTALPSHAEGTTDSTVKERKLKFVLQITDRSTFIQYKHLNILSVLVGVQYKNRHQFSIGIFTLPFWNKPKTTSVNDTTTATTDVKLFYPCLGYNYIFLNTRHFKLSIPVELGYGFVQASAVIDWPRHEVKAERHANFIPAEIGLYAEWKATKWAGIHASLGYRKLLFEQFFAIPNVTINYDGIYYYYGINLYLNQIVKEVKRIKIGSKK